ncbi:hypothetical protein BCR36DRAFT_333217 [Piromyces finnis]|uniref:Uncharacterized protein n=1 Tax=Piromyces finnis TaxID=1754191 RepID=A0A1Y1V1W8_9FUNG|nr:hypothetical protein BCR36DRAFT_333217 [Piromyces finnis]|eukprot:ORX45405.1 hypothetical protein BCR36DRAFT_333217 [Piromyces finnis]
MGHTFICSDSLDISAVEGHVIKNICENENEQITDINVPVEGSFTFDYSKFQELLNKLQDKNNNFSDKEIDKLYEEGKEILSSYKYSNNSSKSIRTLHEELDLLYLSLKKNSSDSNVWKDFKKSKIIQLGLSFNHSKMNETKVLTEKKYPSKLDPKLTDLKEVLESTYLRYKKCDNPSQTINNLFNYEAYAWLAKNKSFETNYLECRFANVLKNSVDDSDSLLKFIIKEKDKSSIDVQDKLEKLSLSQIQKLAKLDDSIVNNKSYIYIYLKKILPNDPKKLKIDSIEFKQLEDFVKTLKNTNYQYELQYFMLHLKLKNSIKEQLPLNEGDFIKYLEIPYCSLLRNKALANLRTDNRSVGRDSKDKEDLYLDEAYTKEIEDDNSLIKIYLTYFFQKNDKLDVNEWKKYTKYLLNERHLKKIFVEARLTKYPNELQALKKSFDCIDNDFINKVELNFEKYTNPIKQNKNNETTTFRLSLKNINNLYIKEYEINTLAVCKENIEDEDNFYLNFDVSGLLPIKEQSYVYDKNPLERWVEEFKFNYDKRCVYIIEFMGKNLACRAIVRNGDLNFIENKEIYGHVIHIIDENNEFVTGDNYSVWFGNNIIKANKDGEFIIPYGNKFNGENIILSDGKFGRRHYFSHQPEQYSCDVDFILNSEAITMGNKANLVVRVVPKLLYDVPIPCELIENAELNISITSMDNISIDKSFTNIKFNSNNDATVEFTVPENVSKISVSFHGSISISSQSGDKKYDIKENKSFKFNGIDIMNEITDIQLKKNSSGYYLIALGKNGERIPNYVAELKLEHIFVKELITSTLQTDQNGIIELGKLPYIKTLACCVNSNNKYKKNWDLSPKQFHLPDRIVIVEGETINLAYPYELNELQNYPNLYALYRVSSYNKYSVIEDLSSKLNFNTANNIISIKDLKFGCYLMQLDFPYQNNAIEIIVGVKEKIQHVTKLVIGPDNNYYNKYNNKEESIPLQINTTLERNNLNIQLFSNDPSTSRVHVVLSNFYPKSSYYENLSLSSNYPISNKPCSDIEYLYNNDIKMSKEKMYIQSRKMNKNLIGNMLRKPTTILVPFENKKATEEKKDEYNGGAINHSINDFHLMKRAQMNTDKCRDYMCVECNDDNTCGFGNYSTIPSHCSFNYNFLSHPGKCLCNLIPNENGIISIPLDSINEDYSYIEIIAINSHGSISKIIEPPRSSNIFTQNVSDTSMISKLHSDKYYTEKRETATIASGESFEILASSGTKITTVESIAKVLSLASIINPSITNTIKEFSSILTKWDSFTFKEKSQKYSSHICNEINVFIYFKDKEFFNQVIMPFLKSKLIKCFIDKWLLHEDLMEYINDSKKFYALNDFELILLKQAFKDNHSIAEKLTNYLKNKIERMEKKNKSNIGKMKKIFDTIIENGEELNEDEDEDNSDEDLDIEEVPTDIMPSSLNEREESTSFANRDKDRRYFNGASSSRMAPLASASVPTSFSFSGAAPLMEPMAVTGNNLFAAAPTFNASMRAKNMEKLKDIRDKVKKEGPMFYEEIEKTTVWSETGYWKSSINETVNIEMNPFWKDVFEHLNSQEKILSKNFLSVLNKSFTELIFACALLDLPLTNNTNHDITINSQIYKINTKSNVIVLFKQLVETELNKNDSIFCLRSYFDVKKENLNKNDDDEDNSKVNPNEFEPGKIYGCEIIVTNVSMNTKFLDILYQIPNGAICVNSSKKTNIEQIKLDKYSSKNIKFYFYFPKAGEYKHTPVNISYNEEYVNAYFPETTITVNIKNTEGKEFDSWVDVANYSKNEDVLKWLKNDPVSIKQLNQAYWRLKDKSFFNSVIELYRTVYEYDQTLWSYGIYHDNVDITIEYLMNNKKYIDNYEFVYFICNNFVIDSIESKTFTLLDYYPLINKRVHKLHEANGSKMISNKDFSDYYDDLLVYLFHKPTKSFNSRDYLQLVCALLLQDRITDGIILFKIFEKRFLNKDVSKSDSINGLIQRDYIASYLDFYNESYIDEHHNKKLKIARERSMKYDNYPIKNWNNMFSEIIQSINYLDNNSSMSIDDAENKTTKVNNIINNTPSLSMIIINETIHINYKNLSHCKICYYPIDIEMQFSAQPFIISENKSNQSKGKKSNITYSSPKDIDVIELPEDKQSIQVPLNKNYIQQQAIVEIQGGNDYFIKNKCIYQPSKLSIQINENLGIVRVFKPNSSSNNKEKEYIIAPGVYVKVYSKDKSGKITFWKDGYTDLLGRFDYVTISSNSDILNIEKFSILILFNDTMSEIKEVDPPKI